ncbi:modification methylase DpnIIA [Clostridium acetireducens DSM 10703]|uniref:Site-specific DNA-methyltransferase (adenine-specific) n=1 Tax=Clostridium acetireducens DSM 10703 TaxID=1121290 RepID=A0A1E8EVZ2_9CLOT|nr:Dam family site-specific DNA-(adenine-N6)-methyltransferase [Clostridium acetireducens]OFI01422.1 modification methylase DpnIIA [Clostridium acetireducens DSM 10703]
MKTNVKPFLKWAGGKSQLLPQFEQYYPEKLKKGEIKKYIEPFLGGGAVFFYLQSKYNFQEVILNDINGELIVTYYIIQNKIEQLINYLKNLEKVYLSYENMEDKQNMFYEQRDTFNKEKENIDYEKYSENWIYHAARMIFLNKTCFNGLYRQNKRGKYNVPFGKRKKVTICDKENLLNAKEALKGVKLTLGDFESVGKYIDKNTFIYIDPPYRPLSDTSSFTDYSKIPFNDDSQKRLAEWAKSIDDKGALFMLSNSDPTNTNEEDKFFDELYIKFNINRVMAGRMINSKGNRRGKIREILVTNYSK